MTAATTTSKTANPTTSDHKFADAWQKFEAGHARVTDLLHSLGKASGMVHFNTALVLGHNPIPALKKDLQKLKNSKAAIASTDYFRAWTIATHGGTIKGTNLPTPPTVAAAAAKTAAATVGAAGKMPIVASIFGAMNPAASALSAAIQAQTTKSGVHTLAQWIVTDPAKVLVLAYQKTKPDLYQTGVYDSATQTELSADGASNASWVPAQPAVRNLSFFHLSTQAHPVAAAATVAPVSLSAPIPVPVDQPTIQQYTGQTVVAPVAPQGASTNAAPNPQWKLGGAAALAALGTAVAPGPGTAAGAVAGLLGGKVLDDRIKAGLMAPIFARDANGRINIPLSLKKWTGKAAPTGD